MKKINDKDLKTRDELVSLLRTKAERVHDLVQEANEAIERVNEAIVEYNDTVRDANNWCQDLVSQMETYRDERSVKWHDSDTGQQYDSWMQVWSEELNEADEFNDIDAPSMDAADELEQRTSTPDEL